MNGDPMSAQAKKKESLRWIAFLDKFFWLLWILLPISIAAFVYYLNLPETFMPTMTPEQVACAKAFPNPTTFSFWGKVMFWLPIAVLFGFYTLLMGILHRTIHNFATRPMFVDDTLRSMQHLAVALIVYPFVQSLVGMLTSYGLTITDGIPAQYISFIPDVAVIAVGVFLLAVKYVLKNAIDLKTENELTI
jgi:hypothetical protein